MYRYFSGAQTAVASQPKRPDIAWMENGGEGPLDQRQRRTRAALHAALERLIGRMPYTEIGVSLLAQEAEVGRPTFYRHFTNVNDLLIDSLASDMEEQRVLANRLVEDGVDAQAAAIAIARFALDCIVCKPRLYRALLDGSAGANAVTLFRHQMADLSRLMAYPTDDARRAHPALTIAMLSGAISGFLLAWIEDGLTPEPAVAAPLLVAMVLPPG
jgi:AcrR family transcriptional regulator